ncbi:hypothetical protein SNE40_017392 [Patella caerulea]|uniref:Uncharacterized protein n=1 Tax=Patella caerulea TaxID=87958 RepID=A0AAN8JAD3_PATCE
MFSHPNPEIVSEKLREALKACSDWIVDNKLSLHLGKTERMLFGLSRKLKKISSFEIVCNDHVIQATDSVKYLGLYIDHYLSGDLIVNKYY